MAAERYRSFHLVLAVSGSTLLTAAIFLSLAHMIGPSRNVVVLDVDVKEVAKGYRGSELACTMCRVELFSRNKTDDSQGRTCSSGYGYDVQPHCTARPGNPR